MEFTECTCPEPTCPRCLATLGINGCERRHYTDEIGDHCCIIHTLNSRILCSTLLKLAPELQEAKDALAVTVEEERSIALTAAVEIARIKAKRLAGEALTTEEQTTLFDHLLGL